MAAMLANGLSEDGAAQALEPEARRHRQRRPAISRVWIVELAPRGAAGPHGALPRRNLGETLGMTSAPDLGTDEAQKAGWPIHDWWAA